MLDMEAGTLLHGRNNDRCKAGMGWNSCAVGLREHLGVWTGAALRVAEGYPVQ